MFVQGLGTAQSIFSKSCVGLENTVKQWTGRVNLRLTNCSGLSNCVNIQRNRSTSIANLSVTVTRTRQFHLLAVLAAHVESDLRVLVIFLTKPKLRHAVEQFRQVLCNLQRNN